MRYPFPPAVVVGACGHGLAIMRALHADHIPVIAVESDRRLPGTRTAAARMHFVPDIQGEDLIDALLQLRPRIACPGVPALFLTNDTMVRTVGAAWPRLEAAYRLSWSHCRAGLLPLLEKTTVAARCKETGLAHPATFVLAGAGDSDAAVAAVGFPMIVKPSRPLSGFKTALPHHPAELAALARRFHADLPFVVQRFIPGDDRAIFVAALYLDHGKIVARFEGRKIRSRPLGHTTIAQSAPDDQVFAHARRFFDGLGLSGPVSLELKRDPDGKPWVIEPTVGRTDFWLGLCTANGVNLALIEYRHQNSRPLPAAAQTNAAVWFNEERDPFGRLWFGRQNDLAMDGREAAYVYFDRSDRRPGVAALLRTGTSLVKRACRRAARLALGGAPGWSVPTRSAPRP